ncbi:MAG: hypothetical protein JJU29_13675 [Verrucomicrobia bacterium]|nr:hypothetical protein [Verrucomicrobiota bacterium]MCH8510640.1 GldG family protein [Kiritimatiellia bacterium]
MKIFGFCLLFLFTAAPHAAEFLYIHGDVSPGGDSPSGGEPFHQMLLTDTGRRGMSVFREIVESKGHTIRQQLDRETELTAESLENIDVIIFGLHQKRWSESERDALHDWLVQGGSMIIYSDSATGGHWGQVGAQNPVGQTVVNNLIRRYGMEVTVDQANGVRAVRPPPNPTHPIVADRPVLEGEGVSLFAVSPYHPGEILIPYVNDPEVVVSGTPTIPHKQNITIENPDWAALVRMPVGEGQIFGVFDRQPFWNAGEGSDITKRDNRLILERLVDAVGGSRE